MLLPVIMAGGGG
ncbi:mannose-1-phosphate guanylyltransferase/mannose-6-phosphate isomerase, partial [Yersinia pestis PY-45]